MKKIAIAIHGTNNVDFGAYVNHLNFIAGLTNQYELFLITTKNVKIAEARNLIIDKALGLNCDYILFLDTDHIVPIDMLFRLIALMEHAKVASGLICRRRGELDVIGYVKDEGWHKVDIKPNTGFYFVDSCAFGCTLIDMSVFAELVKPYFYDDVCFADEGTSRFRGDTYFCMNVRQLGHKVIIDSGIEVGHIGEPYVVYPSTCMKLKEIVASDILKLTHV